MQFAAGVAKLVFDPGFAGIERPIDMVSFIRRHIYNRSILQPSWQRRLPEPVERGSSLS